MSSRKNYKGFTVVELMVGILIFTIGGLSAYLLVFSALNSSRHSKNEIIAANLARESIELIRNNRNDNWLQILDWNKLDNVGLPGKYLTGGYYIIENNFSPSLNSKTKITKLSNNFSEDYKYLINPTNPSDKTQLCNDSQNRYTHDCLMGNKETKFYSYIKVEPLITKTNKGTKIDVYDAYRIIANVINSEKGFTKYYVPTIITNWKK